MSKAIKSVTGAATKATSFMTGASSLSKAMGGSNDPIGQAMSGMKAEDQLKMGGVANRLSSEAMAKARGQDIAAGQKFAQEVLPAGSLGRLGEQADISASLEVLRGQLGGLTSQEMQAQRDVVGQGINRNTEMARRRLAAAQARSGVRGAAAGKQQSDVIMGGMQQGAQMEQQLMMQQRAAQQAAAQNLLNASGKVSQFDLGQAAREKFAELQTGLGFAQIGSAERAGQAAASASVSAAQAQAPQGGMLGGLLGK